MIYWGCNDKIGMIFGLCFLLGRNPEKSGENARELSCPNPMLRSFPVDLIQWMD